MWNVLKKFYAPNIVDKVRGMKILKDGKGVVFDIPIKDKEIFEEIAEDLSKDNFKLYAPQELPETEDHHN